MLYLNKIIGPNKKMFVFRVTLPYLIFLVKPSIFFFHVFSKKKVFMLNIQTRKAEQTVKTQIKLLLKEQFDQGLHCMPCYQYF